MRNVNTGRQSKSPLSERAIRAIHYPMISGGRVEEVGGGMGRLTKISQVIHFTICYNNQFNLKFYSI